MKGIRQSCRLSPLLFNIYIYIEEAMKKFHYMINNEIKNKWKNI